MLRGGCAATLQLESHLNIGVHHVGALLRIFTQSCSQLMCNGITCEASSLHAAGCKSLRQSTHTNMLSLTQSASKQRCHEINHFRSVYTLATNGV